MRFDNSDIRRQDRLLGEAEALALLRDAEYGFLSMQIDQGAYGVPVNYVLDGDLIYIHCAPEGRKLRAIEYDARVSFCVVGQVKLRSEEFTTNYNSVIVSGYACRVDDEQQKRVALRKIVDKYSSEYRTEGYAAIERSLPRTAVIAINIEKISAKRKG